MKMPSLSKSSSSGLSVSTPLPFRWHSSKAGTGFSCSGTSLFYWKLLAVHLGFIIAFKQVVFFFLHLIAWVVLDVPAALAAKIKRERYLAK